MSSQSDIPTISWFPQAHAFDWHCWRSSAPCPGFLSLHSAAALPQPQLPCAGELRCIHWDSMQTSVPLENAVFTGHCSTEDCHCWQVSESHAAHTASPMLPEVPQLLHGHGGHLLQSQQCLMALGWPCNMVPTADTLSIKVLVKLAACHGRACCKWHSYLQHRTARSLIFLTNTHLAYPNFSVFYGTGENTGIYSQDLIAIALTVLSWRQ